MYSRLVLYYSSYDEYLLLMLGTLSAGPLCFYWNLFEGEGYESLWGIILGPFWGHWIISFNLFEKCLFNSAVIELTN